MRRTLPKSYTLEEAARLLREWQINEWSLDRRITKTAKKEQRRIVERLVVGLTQREVADVELDFVLSSMN
jgi:hypothetical protein